MKTFSLQAAARWVAAASLSSLMVCASAKAQIPKEVVDNAVALKMGPSVKLSACEQHTYKHRLRLQKVAVQTEGDTLTYTGEIENVIKWDTNGLMGFKITLRGDAAPEVKILSVREPKKIQDTLKDAAKFLAAILPVLSKTGTEATKELVMSEFASSQGERDAARAAVESLFAGMDQKDWKTPCQALISAIAARLYEMHRNPRAS
jgi:hypothetical protein